MKNVVSLILGGGKGTRLFPLTQFRSKPAVPLAGKYRLIDIPISNCINSELSRIYLLTQFNSVSLHRHIRQTYKFDSFGGGFVEILAAQQTMEGTDWYQGTADAVRKNIRCIEQSDIDYVLILSGDQLYRMDYAEMLTNHIESNADVSIATVPLSSEQAAAFGIMRVDDSGRVKGFLEKPQTEEELKMVRTPPEWIDQQGIESRGRDCLASMGIYLFNRDLLVDLLKKTDYEDFGKEIFPMSIRTHKVHAHLFDGYWEDIGTIRSFYDANLALAHPNPPFDFVVEKSPIYSRPRFLPPTRCEGVTIKRSLIADGCEIDEGAVIENSVIGLRCRIGKNVTIRNSVIMGADYYQDECKETLENDDRPAIGIGDGAFIDGAIVDKNCRVGKNARIEPNGHSEQDFDHTEVLIRDGIIVVPRGTVLADGWKL
ncbi:glucose-1-phosphate adenylyltransferase [Gimesia maris]|uniref:Glucose-1-phosphate adenylyltransferase n=2 Tax=Gimesia maris TaxID=122 RepID=A0ABX5YTE1_9PLAN|nr:glucose-1-phosphate adenylyltransferase [Gimesia maris]QEG18903.1 Glucose-1-phosphate adenylyltransferase [Gimesia maris]QGQ28188.1 glucose-1-phosphate adenylyltransferase [Gimesia maris]